MPVSMTGLTWASSLYSLVVIESQVLVGSFPGLFGSEMGEDLRKFCSRHGVPLAWSLSDGQEWTKEEEESLGEVYNIATFIYIIIIIFIIYHYIASYSTTRYCSSSNSTIFVDHIIRRDYSCDWVLGEPGPRKLDWLPWEPFEYWHSDGERLLDPIAGWAHTSQPSSGGSVTCQRLEANPPTEASGNSVEYLIRCRCSHSLTQPRAFPAEFDSRS